LGVGLLSALLGVSCGPAEKAVPVAPAPAPAAAGPVIEDEHEHEDAHAHAHAHPEATGKAGAEKEELEVAEEVAREPANVDAKGEIYSGVHKLGVNRVTDMARVGSARFSRKGGVLQLQGRVARGAHWLELSGRVEPEGPTKFVLIGTIRGVPDMAWADEAPRERNTEGRFTFEIRKGRPYFRLYEVNGRECVCHDDCGNDFCYIDIEQQPIADDMQKSAK
jgi:hypothetical protein